MINPITFNDFIALAEPVPLVDVRTPAEFDHGHIPGAFNIPLFSNEERVQVGTTYKQVSREAAILLGFDLTGPKWSDFIRRALEIAPLKKIGVHCWRGGMRSGAMAWALNLYGFEVCVIRDGYKAYRRWALSQFEAEYKLCILGGLTGTGKTKILHEFRSLGEQVIDLEDLAQHQGSSYGSMNKLVQPTQEQFENNLANELHQLNRQNRVWVEDESLTIGKNCIPNKLWQQMRIANLIEIRTTAEQRIEYLASEYGQLDKDFLVECTQRIRKRLGPEQTKNAIAAIREDRMHEFVRIALVYYDKTYRAGLEQRNPEQVSAVDIDGDNISLAAKQVLQFLNENLVAG
jgi:tRNA 2-selenouridine synthase